MTKLSLKATGWAAVISWEFLNVMMLTDVYLRGNSEQGKFQTLWLQGLYPGYQTLNASGIAVALIEGFIWPWVFAWVFVTVYNRVLR
ncbi:MAG: hypothetical protein AAB429_02690 [Patescibacteria group bacterium]